MPNKKIGCFFILFQVLMSISMVGSLPTFSKLYAEDKVIPTKFPDLTKGEPWTPPENKGKNGQLGFFNLGPTGLMGFMIGGVEGSQILVTVVLKDSPASGKFKVGDVILGINNRLFKSSGDLTEVFGAAINDAEKEVNKGKMKFMVWRDKNYHKRNGTVDVESIDVDDAFIQIEEDVEGAVFNWLDKTEQKKSLEKMNHIPMNSIRLEIRLNIPVLGTYSDMTPYDCPKANIILERGLKIVRKNFKKSKSFGLYFMKAHALIASGDPNDLAMVKKRVREVSIFKPDRKISEWGYHYGSWYSGYQLVFGCDYYLRTGDEYILPALNEIATKTATGQNYGGSWGHKFSDRSFNMGKLNMRAPGYGAMNQAGGPCFLGLVMAQKCGINNSHIERAIKRGSKFYKSISELGATPYGMHPVANQADSNGKNGPPAYAFKLLEEKTDAQYFTWCMSVSSWWGHGGHGGGAFGAIWRTIGASLGGPLSVNAYHKNRTNWYAMGRRHDGGWLLHYPGGGPFFRDDHTALYVLRHMAPLANTYFTGKDPMKECKLTKDTLQDVYDGNGVTKVSEMSNEQLLHKLKTFYPLMRDLIAQELGKRYREGRIEKLVEKIILLFDSKEPRLRAAAALVIAECGEPVIKKQLKKILKMFDDPRQFVRINAIRAIGKHFKSLEEDVVVELMKLVTREEYWDMYNDNNNVPSYVFALLYQQEKSDDPNFKPFDLAGAPFREGYNELLTRETMERGFRWDPGRANLLNTVYRKWSRDQVIDMAGPIVFGAEFLQYNDMMFAREAMNAGRNTLEKHNFLYELIHAASYDLHLLHALPRNYYAKADGHGPAMSGKTPFDAFVLKEVKGQARFLLKHLKRYLVRKPLWKTEKRDANGKVLDSVYLIDLIREIEKDKQAVVPKSIQKDVDVLFAKHLSKISSKSEQIKYCRKWLNHERKTYFRQISAMNALVKLLGEKAIPDLLPFLNHENWRWREYSRSQVQNLGQKATATVIKLYNKEENVSYAAGLMACLNLLKDPKSKNTVLKALNIAPDVVKAEAVQAIVNISRYEHLQEMINIFKSIDDVHALDGFEKAMLMSQGNRKEEIIVINMLVKHIMKSRSKARSSIYYVLAQLGGEKVLDVLARVSRSRSEKDFKNVVNALSLSRDSGTNDWLIKILKENEGTRRSFTVADACVKRMVLGPNGVGKNNEKENVLFANEVLAYVSHTDIIQLLGFIPKSDAAELIFKLMKKGPKRVTRVSAESIIFCSERFDSKAPLEERKRMAELLRNVIEYITVTELRIPDEERGRDGNEYYEAKKLCDKAGKLLSKIYDPDEEAVEDIDDELIDI